MSELTFLEKRKQGIEKIFKDLKVGDEIHFQHLHKIADYYGWSCSLVNTETITNIDKTKGCNDIVIHTKNHTFHIHSCLNIDVYYEDKDNKYYVGTNVNNLMAFLNATIHFNEKDIVDKMIGNIELEINQRIVERLIHKYK